MSLIFGVLLALVGPGQLPETKIDDSGILSAFRIYLDSLIMNGDREDAKYHLVAKMDSSGNEHFLYVQSVVSLKSFWRNVPDEYSRLNDGRLVFWYKDGGQVGQGNNSASFQEFRSQFGKYLINNLSPEGIEVQSNETKVLLTLNYMPPYRFEVQKDKIENVKKLCGPFPDHIFFSKGYSYDVNGNMLYDSGIYSVCALDRPFDPLPKGYEINNYIKSKTSLSSKFINDKRLTYYLIIDEEGRVDSVRLYENDQEKISKEVNDELVKIMIGSPKWNAGTVRGKKVKYQVAIGLFFL